MKIDDIEISFGKSVLIEKSQRPEFLLLVNSLCQDVPGSFLHCFLSDSGWTTIIRYSKLQTNLSDDYCLLRVILLKHIKKDEQKCISETTMKLTLFERSYKAMPYITIMNCVRIGDSSTLICHKEFLTILINEITKEVRDLSLQLSLLQIDAIHNPNCSYSLPDIIPCVFGNKPSKCDSLYGTQTHNMLFDNTPEISTEQLIKLIKCVNHWKIKLKRKGRRALKKNLTLKPI